MKAILFDMDDTLLGNDMDVFIPQYFKLIGSYATTWLPRDKFVTELLIGTREMIADSDPATTNGEVFWRVFAGRTGLDPVALRPHFDHFYQYEFDQLKQYTEYRPVAPDLVRWCFAHDYKVVVATNPLFPRLAIEARLAWSGLPVSNYGFDLVTSMDNMHSAKPNVAYYEEILAAIDCSPAEAIMIGDSWENDIAPAAKLGLRTYWIAEPEVPAPAPDIADGRGSLADFYAACRSGWLTSLEPVT